MNQRANAALNPTAIYRDPMTMDDYLNARLITTPFGLYDCDVPCDGAIAVIVSAVDVAKDMPASPVLFEAVGTQIIERTDWDQTTMTHEPQVLGQSAHLWTRTSLRPNDVDVAELYDGFSFNCLSWLEALGFCGIGEAKDFLDGGKAIARDGVIPLNTHGGQLSHGRTHGMGLIHEAVTQLRGEAGERQVKDARVAVVSSGGLTPSGAILLRTDERERTAPRPRVVLVDGVPMSGLVAEAADPRAVVVAFHGGASTAAYFDCPGHPRLSLLRIGAALGYTVVALDRPGYGASAPYPDAIARPDRRVALAYGAVDKILGANPRGAGLFLLAHSAGCELAVRMAADERAEHAALIGLELAGTGLQYADDGPRDPKDRDRHSAPSRAARVALAARAPLSGRGAVRNDELRDGRTVRGGDGQRLAATRLSGARRRGGVPVQFSVADHERVWRSDPEALAEIAAMFTASPRFVVNEQAGTGHNLSLSVERRGVPHEGAVVRRGMCRRASERIEELEAG